MSAPSSTCLWLFSVEGGGGGSAGLAWALALLLVGLIGGGAVCSWVAVCALLASLARLTLAGISFFWYNVDVASPFLSVDGLSPLPAGDGLFFLGFILPFLGVYLGFIWGLLGQNRAL